jgi:superfamily II DNA/RNA helicase
LRHKFSAGALHGDMAQSLRFTTLEKFKAGELQLLVCSDVAARGLDIGGLSHVFNFDVPHHAEDYVHRIGRTGRAGREGRALTLAAPDERATVEAIEKLIGHPIPRISIGGLDPVEWQEPGPKRRRRGGPAAKSSFGHREGSTAKVASKQLDRQEHMGLSAPAPTLDNTGSQQSSEPKERQQRRKPTGQKVGTLSRGEHGHNVLASQDAIAPVRGFGEAVPAFMLISRRQGGANNVTKMKAQDSKEQGGEIAA